MRHIVADRFGRSRETERVSDRRAGHPTLGSHRPPQDTQTGARACTMHPAPGIRPALSGWGSWGVGELGSGGARAAGRPRNVVRSRRCRHLNAATARGRRVGTTPTGVLPPERGASLCRAAPSFPPGRDPDQSIGRFLRRHVCTSRFSSIGSHTREPGSSMRIISPRSLK